MDTDSILLKALISLRDKGPLNVTQGICHNVKRIGWDELANYELSDFMEGWPKHSRNNVYPIKVGEEHPGNTYNKTENLWDRNTEYGQLRWELLNYMIETLEKQLCV